MSKKAEITAIVIADLEASPQQAIFNDFLDEVKASINNPGVQWNYIKYFTEPIDLNVQAIFKLISMKDLGFECIVRENLIAVDMIKFLC